jgi:Transposase DDE domain.
LQYYVFFDDLLKSISYKEPKSRKTTDAEIITTMLIAAQYFGGNIEKSISFVRGTGLMPTMLGKSRFNRRMHAVAEIFSMLFFEVGQIIKNLNTEQIYSIDSFPVPVCHNIRISNSKIIQGEEYRGYCASKRTYFYGFKVHVIVTDKGIPVEYTFTVGSTHDIDGLRQMPLAFSQKSTLFADSAYTDYGLEEMLADDGINLLAARKQNAKKKHEPWVEYIISTLRKRVETSFSDIAKYFPKTIHAVTDKGLLIKLIAFVFGYTMDKIL